MTKYTLKATTQFKKDYKLVLHRDHALNGNWVGYRECHIQPNWLLIYHIHKDILVLTLTRTGTHSDLFQK